MITILNFLLTKAPIVDKKIFLKNEKTLLLAVRFFYISSYLTKFFLFSIFGTISFSIYCSYCFYNSVYFFKVFVISIGTEGLSGILNTLHLFPKSLVFLLVFYSLIVDITLINTFLVNCNSVNNKIRLIYGQNFIKEQYYNSSLLTAYKVQQTGKILMTGIGVGVLGGTVASVFSEFFYHKNYNSYLTTVTENPEMAQSIKAPKKGFGF